VRASSALIAGLVVAVAGCGGSPTGTPTRTASQAALPRAAPAAAVAGPALSPPLTRRPAGRVLRIGPQPDAVAADPRAHTFAVAIHDPSRLVLLDSRTGKVAERVAVPKGQRAIVPPAVFLVPAEAGRRALAIQPEPHTVPAAPPARAALVLGRTFVANPAGHRVDVLDRGRPTRRLDVDPAGLAPADFDRTLAVVAPGERALQLYDPRTLARTASVPAGRGPTNVASEGDRVYDADTAGDAVLVYATQPRLRPAGRVALPGAPYALAVDPVARRLYVTLTARNQLVVLRTDRGDAPTVVRRYATVRQPDAVAIDSSLPAIAVTGRAGGVLELIAHHSRGLGSTAPPPHFSQ
jgi:hypothetical protein